jgi:hypothetical protein
MPLRPGHLLAGSVPHGGQGPRLLVPGPLWRRCAASRAGPFRQVCHDAQVRYSSNFPRFSVRASPRRGSRVARRQGAAKGEGSPPGEGSPSALRKPAAPWHPREIRHGREGLRSLRSACDHQAGPRVVCASTLAIATAAGAAVAGGPAAAGSVAGSVAAVAAPRGPARRHGDLQRRARAPGPPARRALGQRRPDRRHRAVGSGHGPTTTSRLGSNCSDAFMTTRGRRP